MAEDKNIYTEVFPFAGNNDTLDKLDKYIKETVKCECDHDGGGSSSGSSDDPLIVNFTIQADQSSVSGFSSVSDVVSTDAARAFYAGRRVIGLCNLKDIYNVNETLILTPGMIGNEDSLGGDYDDMSFSVFSHIPSGGFGMLSFHASYYEGSTQGVGIIPISNS